MLQFGNRVPWKHAGLTAIGEAGWSFLTIELHSDAGRMFLIPADGKLKFKDLGPQLTLPPEFDLEFDLHGTSGSFEDPLAVITPELMRLLSKQLPRTYVEVVGHQLVITSPRPWYFDGPHDWTLIEQLADAVIAGAKVASGAAVVRMGDVAPRITPGLVAPPPRNAVQLKPSWVGIGVGVLFAIAQIVRVAAEQHPSCGC